MDGWIKLHRKFLNWEWYEKPAVKSVFLHLLLTANIESRKWQGIEIKRGQTVTSIEKISKATGHSVQEVRTAINKLKSTQCITQSKHSKFSVFTVINFDSYQNATEFPTSNQQAANTQATGNQQATNNTIRNKEYKKERSKEDITPPTPSKGTDEAAEPPKEKYAEFVSMTNDEYTSLVAKLGEQGAKQCIEILDNYKGANGKTYKSDYRAILNWVVKRYEEERAKSPAQSVQKNYEFDPNDPYAAWRGRNG